MAVTNKDIAEKLKSQFNPDDIVELLDISSEDLVDRFSDLIETKSDYLAKELDLEEEDGGDN